MVKYNIDFGPQLHQIYNRVRYYEANTTSAGGAMRNLVNFSDIIVEKQHYTM